MLTDPNRHPGRWDPPDFQYRVLYTADTLENAYIEILFDLQPRAQAREILEKVVVDSESERSEVDVDGAITAYLLPRYAASIIVAGHPYIVRVDDNASRQMIAEALECPPLRIGDLTGSDVTLCRAVSQVVYRDQEIGIACSSALTTGAINYSFF